MRNNITKVFIFLSKLSIHTNLRHLVMGLRIVLGGACAFDPLGWKTNCATAHGVTAFSANLLRNPFHSSYFETCQITKPKGALSFICPVSYITLINAHCLRQCINLYVTLLTYPSRINIEPNAGRRNE